MLVLLVAGGQLVTVVLAHGEPGLLAVVVLLQEWQRERLAEIERRDPGRSVVETERSSGRRVLTVVALPLDGWSTAALVQACARNAES